MPGTVSACACALAHGPSAAQTSAARAAIVILTSDCSGFAKASILPASRGFPDRVYRARDDEVEALPSDLRARAARIAVDTVGVSHVGRLHPVDADKAGVRGERERSVRRACMVAYLRRCESLGAHHLREFFARRVGIPVDRMRADFRLCPLALRH